jgi:Ca2+-transporting ATPase
LFSGSLLAWSLMQGALVLALTAGVMTVALLRGMPADEVRALVFVTLVLTNIGLIFVNRSFSASPLAALRRRNQALWLVLGTALSLLGVVLFWLQARGLFRFGPLHLDDLAVCAGAGIAILLALDAIKLAWRSRLTS